MERHLKDYRDSISYWRYQAARSLFHISMDNFFMTLKWIHFHRRCSWSVGRPRMEAKKQKASSKSSKPRVDTQCSNCMKPDRQMKCSKGRVARIAQSCATQLDHTLRSKNECAHCGSSKPKHECQGFRKACSCDITCQKSQWKEEHKEVNYSLRDSCIV